MVLRVISHVKGETFPKDAIIRFVFVKQSERLVHMSISKVREQSEQHTCTHKKVHTMKRKAVCDAVRGGRLGVEEKKERERKEERERRTRSW